MLIVKHDPRNLKVDESIAVLTKAPSVEREATVRESPCLFSSEVVRDSCHVINSLRETYIVTRSDRSASSDVDCMRA